MRVFDMSDVVQPVIVLSSEVVYGQKIIRFSSPKTEHVACMNIMPETIVVEHDIPFAETATFDIEERWKAIKFVEGLFTLVSSTNAKEAFESGILSYLNGNYNCPFEDLECLDRKFWLLGYCSARDAYPDEECA